MKRIRLEHCIAWLLLIILGFIVIHAPLTVFIESRWLMLADVAKAWKELLLLLALCLLAVEYTRQNAWNNLKRDVFIWATGAFCMVHMVMALYTHLPLMAEVAGLMIDLRYVTYFAVVYAFLKLYPQYRMSFLRVASVGAVIVIGFAMMQLVLPRDFLSYVGYSNATIQPYLTVDENPDYVRLQSTLRGPNPLGAYAMMVSVAALTYGAHRVRQLRKDRQNAWWPMVLGVASLVAVWLSYSRSVMVGLVIALCVLAWRWRDRVALRTRLLSIATLLLIVVVLFAALQHTSFWHNVVVHDNPTTGAAITSNTGHLNSLQEGIRRLATQPLGAGVGSTGSASLYTDHPLIIENQYLFIAHESGWLGLIVFLTLSYLILAKLWRQRDDWLSLAVFASGVGLMVIGLLLPVWADDTVSIVWWGLAGVMIATKGGKNGTTTNQKAKRIA